MAIPDFQFPEDPPAAGRRKLVLNPPRRADSLFQFSISTLLLVMTLSSACLAMTAANTTLGLLLSFIALMAFIRTSITSYLYRKLSVPFDLERQLWEFVASCLLVVFALVAGATSLVAVALVGGVVIAGVRGTSADDFALFATIFLAIGASGLAFAWVLWASRPQ